MNTIPPLQHTAPSTIKVSIENNGIIKLSNGTEFSVESLVFGTDQLKEGSFDKIKHDLLQKTAASVAKVIKRVLKDDPDFFSLGKNITLDFKADQISISNGINTKEMAISPSLKRTLASMDAQAAKQFKISGDLSPEKVTSVNLIARTLPSSEVQLEEVTNAGNTPAPKKAQSTALTLFKKIACVLGMIASIPLGIAALPVCLAILCITMPLAFLLGVVGSTVSLGFYIHASNKNSSEEELAKIWPTAKAITMHIAEGLGTVSGLPLAGALALWDVCKKGFNGEKEFEQSPATWVTLEGTT